MWGKFHSTGESTREEQRKTSRKSPKRPLFRPSRLSAPNSANPLLEPLYGILPERANDPVSKFIQTRASSSVSGYKFVHEVNIMVHLPQCGPTTKKRLTLYKQPFTWKGPGSVEVGRFLAVTNGCLRREEVQGKPGCAGRLQKPVLDLTPCRREDDRRRTRFCNSAVFVMLESNVSLTLRWSIVL
jgi:hypothetical protein